MVKHYNIKVSGRVQGVGFRHYTRKKAIELSINGFVKNKWDRSVYIEAEGEEEYLDVFLERCKQGPSQAYVENVRFSESIIESFKGFDIRS